ncbi:hypothetical protein DXG03_005637 [Asterophora parasitica]|uniref:Uncharacterized protein n=1 Tax=Asterophora parasitica TaxID=117018 RepID=A0A9P7KF87_9AGAR|nr:hypothetical protein DXG03_005637 [Asterophora parasitica]
MGSNTSTPHPKLHAAAFTHPAIDNHAHPLLRSSTHPDLPFEGLISEASGDALTSDAPHTLAFYRAATQLASLFGLPHKGSSQETWDAIKAKRAELEYTELCRRSFEPTGIQCILIDDGLGVRDIVHEIPWHDQFTHSPAKRVVRIEVVAEEILTEIFATLNSSPSKEDLRHGITLFLAKLHEALDLSAADPEVTAFKSVVAYRSGLAVYAAAVEEDLEELIAAFQNIHERHIGSDKVRLQEKVLNDRVVCVALQTSASCGKPESYYLGTLQGRQALYDVLSETVHAGEITEAVAVEIVENALFHNANRIYNLGLEPHTQAQR